MGRKIMRKLIQTIHDHVGGKTHVTYTYDIGDKYERQTWHDYVPVQTITWNKGDFMPCPWRYIHKPECTDNTPSKYSYARLNKAIQNT
jgi:hypothetical protein